MTHENDSKPRNQPTVVEDRRERAQTDKVRYSTHVDWTFHSRGFQFTGILAVHLLTFGEGQIAI